MKPVLKIDFADFWGGFIKEDNFFYNLLSSQYDVRISDDPDILFFSVYSTDHLKYKCTRVLYSGENERPDFTGCDYAITFDYNDDKRHYRLPLYALYIEQRKWMHQLTDDAVRAANAASFKDKKKFCCMLVSNPSAKKRILFFEKLNKVRRVDSGGRILNNVGGPVANKMEFIKDYKFVFAFENSSFPGYTTEKILEPIVAGSIPIYWGNPKVKEDFNPDRFINYDDFETEEKLIEHLVWLDENEAETLKIISQPVFNNNKIPACIDDNNILAFLNAVIQNKEKQKPVAQTFRQYLYVAKVRWRILRKTVVYYFGWSLRRVGILKDFSRK